MADFAARPVSALNGVGPKKEKALAAVGIENLLDLLTYYPRRYLDRTKEARIGELIEGDEASVLVTISSTSMRRVRGRAMVNSTVTDGQNKMALTFFNQAWREKQLQVGMQAMVFGKVGSFRGQLQMTNPIVDLVGDKTGRIIPVYPQSEKAGLTSWDLAGWISETLRRSLPPKGRGIMDPLPDAIIREHRFVDRNTAMKSIHQPEEMSDMSQARRRLVFDELFRMQMALVQR